MKRIIKLCGGLLLLCILLITSSNVPAYTAPNAPTRVIHVVYDDSMSMYQRYTGRAYTDMWSQALYATEVFAALLGENDIMRVYFMFDFCTRMNNNPTNTYRITLYGRNSTAANARAVRNAHDEGPRAGWTPFHPVRQAHSDLANVTADEKWLIVLTDGDFNLFPPNEFVGAVEDSRRRVEAFFREEQADDVKVYFIAFGDETQGITPDVENHLYFEHVFSGAALLSEMTRMATHVFNINKVNVNPASPSVELDIPMRNLTVFAQGQNVSINGIIDSSGNLVESSALVNVRHSTRPLRPHTDAPYDASLNGYIAEFTQEFPKGNYTISVTGAETIDIFFTPNVDIDVYLTDDLGNEITEDLLEAGEFYINFSLVGRDTGLRLPPSTLLGEIRYTASIISNGVLRETVYTQGDRIVLEEGSHRLEAMAVYLEHNTIRTDLLINTFQNREADFTLDDFRAIYYLTEFGFEPETPFSVRVSMDGRYHTAEEWAYTIIPILSCGCGCDLIDFHVAKGDMGTMRIYPIFLGETKEDALAMVGDHTLIPQGEYVGFAGARVTWSGEIPIRILSGYLQVNFYPVSVPTYELTVEGIVNADEPIIVNATVDGREITPEEWAMMTVLPTAVAEAGNIGALRVEKSDVPGHFMLFPTLYRDRVSGTDAVNSAIVFSYTERIGNRVWIGDGAGEGGLSLSMTDSRTWLERNLEDIIRWTIIGLIILLILGYIPPFKRYLPKSLKSRPQIDCKPNTFGQKRQKLPGSFSKSVISTIIPYKAQTGTIRFLPKGVTGASAAPLQVKAARGSSMHMMNYRAYAGKKHILFNGIQIPKDAKKKDAPFISPGTQIEVKTENIKYICMPNIQN